jgi:hypothetical protein
LSAQLDGRSGQPSNPSTDESLRPTQVRYTGSPYSIAATNFLEVDGDNPVTISISFAFKFALRDTVDIPGRGFLKRLCFSSDETMDRISAFQIHNRQDQSDSALAIS